MSNEREVVAAGPVEQTTAIREFSQEPTMKVQGLQELVAALLVRDRGADAMRLPTADWPSLEAQGSAEGHARAMIELYRREAAEAAPEQASLLMCEIAHLQGWTLGDQQSAREAVLEALSLAPGSELVQRTALEVASRQRTPHEQAALLSRVAEAAVAGPGRAELLLALGQIQAQLGDESQAAERLEAACAEDPGNTAAIEALLQLRLRQGNWVRVGDLCARLADADEDPQTRFSLLLGAALLDEAAGSREPVQLAAQALSAGRSSELAAMLTMTGLAQRSAWDDVAGLLEDQANARPEQATAFRFAGSRVQAERLGDLSAAIAAAEAALEQTPDDLILLDWLSELYRRETRWPELAEVLRRRIELAGWDPERVELRCALAEVLESRLGQSEEAIEVLHAALQLAPADPQALQASGRLLAQAGKWETLARMHLGEATAVQAPRRRAAALHRCGRIFAEKLERSDEAIAHLQRALELYPRFVPAARLLETLLRQEGRHLELVDLFSDELALTEETETKILLLMKIATLRDEHLEQPERAAAAYRQVLDLQSDNLAALEALSELLQRLGQREEMLSILRALAIQQQGRERIDTLIRMGHTFEALGVNRMALSHYREALELAPGALELYGMIGRLLHAEGRWQELVELYSKQIEAAEDGEDLAGLLYKIGRIQEQQVDDPVAAGATYRRALEVEAGHWPALKGLLRVARHLDEPLSVAWLDQQLELRGGRPADVAVNLVRVGLVLEESAGEATGAAHRLYDRALGLCPDNPMLRSLCLQHRVQGKRWEDLLGLLPPLEATIVAGFGLRDIGRALEIVRRGADGEDLATRRWIETLTSVAGEREARVIALRGRIALEDNPQRRAQSRLRLASLLRLDGADRKDGVDNEITRLYREILADHPGDPRALGALQQVAEQRDDTALLEEVYCQWATRGASPRARARARARSGELHLRQDRRDTAVEAFRAALEEDPCCRPAYDGLKWLCAGGADDDLLAWTLERGIEAVSDPSVRSLDLIRRADFRERRGDVDSAVADLDRVLDLSPAQPNALARLERILLERDDLAGVVRRLQSAAERSPVAQRAGLDLRLGLLLRGRGDLIRAKRHLNSAISADPDSVAAMVAAADLNRELDEPTEALALLNRAALRATSAEVTAVVGLEIARITGQVLGDPVRAKASLVQVLEQQPDHLGAHRAMVPIAAELKDDAQLQESLRRLCGLEPDRTRRADYLAQLARRLRATGAPGPEELELMEQALELQPTNISWLEELLQWLEGQGQWEVMDRILTRHVDQLDEQARPNLLLRHGFLLAQRLDRREEAAALLRRALRQDPSNQQAVQLLLEQIQVDTIEAPEQIAEAIELQRVMISAHPRPVQYLRDLRVLCERAGRHDETYCVESCLVVLNAASEEEQYFHKQRRRRAPGQLTGALDERDGVALALPCGDHPVRRVLIALQDQLPDLIPVDLEHYGLSGGADARLAKDHPAQGLVASCAEALGVERYEVTEALGGALRGAVEPGTPPLILLPHGVSRLPAPAQLFLYGRLLTRLVAGTQALDPGRSEKLAPRDLELLLAAIQRTADPGFGEAVAPAAILDDLTRRIQSIVPAEQLAQARAAAAEAFQGQQDDVLLRWIRSTELGACRGGLLCSGSLVSAVTFLRNTTEGLLPDDIVGDLISFTSSSLCTDLRRKVGLSLME